MTVKKPHKGFDMKKFTFLSALILITFCSSILHAKQDAISVKSHTKDGSTKIIKLYSGYYALVVGCGAYQSGWPKLPNPLKDAHEVAKTLKSMGWEVDLLEDPDSVRLKTAVNRLIIGKGSDREKGILFWFSGHGHTLEEADGTQLGYLVPIDAPSPSQDEMGFMMKAIDMRQMETVAKRIRSKHVIMIFDSCFSGAIFSMVRAAPSAFIEEKTSAPVREFITAGNENEQVPDRSVFKTCFIQGVKDGYADLNRDGYVSGEELGYYLQENVVNYSNKAQHPQFGKINNPKLDKGDFVFKPASTTEGPADETQKDPIPRAIHAPKNNRDMPPVDSPSAATQSTPSQTVPTTIASVPKPNYRQKALPTVLAIVSGTESMLPIARSHFYSAMRENKVKILTITEIPMLREKMHIGDTPISWHEIKQLVPNTKAQVLVLANIRKTGTMPIRYLGRSDTLTLASFSIEAVDMGTGALIHSSTSGSIKFTALNMDDKIRDGVSDATGGIEEVIRQYWNEK